MEDTVSRGNSLKQEAKMEHRILIIARSPGFRRKLALALLRASFEVVTCSNYEAALRQMSKAPPGLIVVDENNGIGWDTCRRLRQIFDTPIMIMGDDPSAQAWVKAVSFGADFYFRRSEGNLELAARARALLRHNSHNK
jgi:DNA-binding response OmpR family regulator